MFVNPNHNLFMPAIVRNKVCYNPRLMRPTSNHIPSTKRLPGNTGYIIPISSIVEPLAKLNPDEDDALILDPNDHCATQKIGRIMTCHMLIFCASCIKRFKRVVHAVVYNRPTLSLNVGFSLFFMEKRCRHSQCIFFLFIFLFFCFYLIIRGGDVRQKGYFPS